MSVEGPDRLHEIGHVLVGAPVVARRAPGGLLKAAFKVLRTAVLLLLVGGIGVGVWRYVATHAQPEVTYRSAPVGKHRIVAKVTASGTLSPLVTVIVSTQVSGRIQAINVDFNSRVTKGEVIAKIDPQIIQAILDRSKANYAEAEASLASANARAKNADAQLARSKILREKVLATQQELDSAEATAAMAHADVDAQKENLQGAAAALHQAQVNLSYTNIVSPIDGVVISRNVDVGQTVTASLSAPTLFKIAQDLTKMQLDTDVAEGDVGRLEAGMPAIFTVDAFPGERFKGSVVEIRNSPTTVKNVVTFDAVVQVDNADMRLRPGMTAKAKLSYAERAGVLAVPNAALRFQPSSAVAAAAIAPVHAPPAPGEPAAPRVVYVLRAGEPEPVSIHTGLSDGTHTEVLDGDLKDGDEVIVDTVSADAPVRPRRRS
jgi:HlyD family secretion protein